MSVLSTRETVIEAGGVPVEPIPCRVTDAVVTMVTRSLYGSPFDAGDKQSVEDVLRAADRLGFAFTWQDVEASE